MKLLLLFLRLALAVEALPCRDNQHCDTCKINGQCLSKCATGFYGYHCKHRCSTGCKNDVCHLTTSGSDECTFGCKLGFHGSRCNIPCEIQNNICRKCPHECEGGFCQLGSSCAQGCQNSFYGTKCKSCPPWCKVCNRVSGTCEVCCHCEGNCTHGCLEGCKVGYYGNFCEHTCSSGCLTGCYQTSGYCFDCESGWFGATCKKHCPYRCMDGACDINGICTSGCSKGWFGQKCEGECSMRCFAEDCNQVGVCTQGCKDGWYGPQCKSKCATGCREKICARNGNCVYGCKVDFYGIKCENQCSASCLNKVCDDKDGTCSSCEKGFFGSQCDKSCVRCAESSCAQDTGHCIQGCLPNYRGEFCQHDCKRGCTIDECLEVCSTNMKEGEFTSNSIPYTVAAVVVVIVSALVTYAACRFKRLQSVIYGSKRGERHNFQPQTEPTEETAEPTVNFYCHLDEDATIPPQLPRRCGTQDIASPLTLSRNQHESISNSQESVFRTQSEQRDDTSDRREKATPSPESDSPVLAEHHGDASVQNNECEDIFVAADLVLHVPSRTNSYLTDEEEDVNEGMQVDFHTEQVKATRSDARPPEMVDMRRLTRSQEDFLSVQSVYAQASCFYAGPSHVTTETRNDCEAVTNVHVKDGGFDKNPSLCDEPQEEGFTDSDGLSRATEHSTNTSHITAESSEDDIDPTTISVPVIADCYDNFSLDDKEEAIPNPTPDNYSKLHTTNYVRK